MLKLWFLLAQLRRDVRGISALEYAVLAALVIAAVVAAVSIFSTNLSGLFTDLFADVDEAIEAAGGGNGD